MAPLPQNQTSRLLEQAHVVNRRLEAECEHLAYLIAASPDNSASTPATNLMARGS